MYILDPYTQTAARVTEEGFLTTKAVHISNDERAAEIGDSFIIHVRCHLAAAVSGGLLHFVNTSSLYMYHLTRLYFVAHKLTKNIIITHYKNATRANGTAYTSVVTKEFASPNVPEYTLYASDGSSDLTLTGGSAMHAFPLSNMTSTMRDMNGTNILKQNNSLSFGWETFDGAAATDGEI